MGIFDRFPYSSTHEMNLDFMLGKATEIAEDMQTVTTGMAQVQAGLSAISEKTEQATQAAAQAAQSASSIEGSVTAAEEAAEEAQMHNESAQTWANNALTYKADCQRAATEAAASSSSAAQAATAAAASEDTVAQYAQAANASAQSAANNNDSAHQYANQASASASNATFHSSNAQTAATNAQTAATNANTSATNAAASADRAATLKDNCETLSRMSSTAVDQAAEQAVAAANSAAQAAATKTDVENLVESLPEDFTDLNNTVNQLSDDIGDLKSALNKSVGLSKSTAKALNNTIVIEHQETVEANTGGHVYMFDTPIPEGATVKISNLSANASISVNAFKIDGTYETVVSSLGYGMSTSVVASFDMFGVRSYVGAGTDWHIKFEYGNTGANSLVFFSIDQSSKTSEEKQTARNNIGAASQEDVEQIQNDILFDDNDNIFDTTLSNGYIKWSDGTTDSLANAKYSDYIAVGTGDVITYSLHAIAGVGAVIACYDAGKVYQQNRSVKGLGTNGTWGNNTGSLTIENGTAFIRFATNSGYLTSDSIVKTKKIKLKDYVAEIDPNIVWNGKNWAAFGTSITDTSYQDVHFLQPTGKYVPFLVEMSGMTIHNYGIAGASIMPNIKDKVLSTNIANEEIITVEGSVNDHATSKPLGEIGDKTADTFAGCIYLIAKYVYENSNATLFFITDYVGRYVHINPAPDGSDFYGDCSPGKTNTLGLKQIDYINMMKAQCEYFSIPCIDAGQKCSINEVTGNLYLMDHIHSSYVGGKQYAQTIWDELKLKKPRVLSA